MLLTEDNKSLATDQLAMPNLDQGTPSSAGLAIACLARADLAEGSLGPAIGSVMDSSGCPMIDE